MKKVIALSLILMLASLVLLGCQKPTDTTTDTSTTISAEEVDINSEMDELNDLETMSTLDSDVNLEVLDEVDLS